VKIVWFSFFVFLFSCNDSTKEISQAVEMEIHPESPLSNDDTSKFVFGKPYINYDKLDYYTIDISQDSVMNLLSNGNKLDSIKFTVLTRSYPTNDTIYELKNLPYYERVGYKKIELNQKYFSQVNKVFCHKKGGTPIALACIHEYRDILVFKKENKVVAIAKICLSCMDINLNGIMDISNEELGWENDFDILDKVLKANKN
jgi:hypothetical protein